MKAFLLAAAAVVVAAPAAAQDMSDTRTGFNGIYVGAAGGYDVQPNDGNARILFDRNLDGTFGDTVLTPAGTNAFAAGFCGGAPTNTAPGTSTFGRGPANGGLGCRKDKDDWSYYGRIGADHQFGAIVVGIVAEGGKTGINDSVTAFSGTPASYAMYREIDWEVGVRARAGFTPNDMTLFYATGGPGYARIDSEFTSSQSTNTFTARGRQDQFGYQAGGGIEQKLGNNFSIGLEYLYHSYQDDDYRVRAASATNAVTPFTNPGNGGTATGTDFRRTDTKFNWHSLRATAAFRF
jgi:outer membrane immunogenic protein